MRIDVIIVTKYDFDWRKAKEVAKLSYLCS